MPGRPVQQNYIPRKTPAQLAAEEKKRVADLKARGLNPDGSPIAPEYQSLADPKTGQLKSQYQLQMQTLDPSKLEGYNMIKALATAQGPSQYAQAANKQAAFNRENMMDAAGQQSVSSMNQALGSLAMRGGVSSGSRERMAMQGQRDLLNSRQGAYRQEAGSLMDIMLQDEKMKRDAQTQFATAEGNIAQGNLGIQNKQAEYNLGTLLKDQATAQDFKMDKYKTDSDRWAAGKQAEATRAAGNSGGGK